MFEYFSDNYTWNVAAVTLVEDVGTISEPGEAFQSVAHLAKGDPAAANEAWYQAMVRLGERLERMADQDHAEKHPLSAARKYHRAAMYFIRAERMLSHLDARRLAAYQRAIADYRKARDYGNDGVEFVDIPYQGGFMPALLIAAITRKPAPIVIHLQGFDSIKETQFPMLQEYRRRGLSCLIVDQPGAGGALRLHRLTAEVESENYVAAIVDYVQSRADIATDQIGLAGISMGGYFAPRAAAFEPRIKACAAWGAFYDGGALVGRGSGAGVAAPSVPNPINHAMWVFGVDTPQAFVEQAKKMTLKGVIEKVACPLLVIHGENDRQVPLQQALDMFEAATTTNKKLKIFTSDEGGVEHCQIDNRALAADDLADWFGGIFMTAREDELRKETLELVRSYQTLLTQRRFDEWIALWAEDGSCEFPYAPEGRPRLLQGKDAIYDYMTAYPDRIAIDSVAEMRVHPTLNPEVVAVELSIKGRALTTGRPYNQRYVIVVEARNGKIWRYREYWNPLISIEAFGGLDAWLRDSSAPQKGGAS